MKENISVPGPARVMYRTYLGALLLVIYSGFFMVYPFSSGWRYPWAVSLMQVFNFYVSWILVLVAFVYLYYSTLGRPKGWKEPLGLFRLFLVFLTIWFFLLTFGVYQPNGWLSGMVDFLGGPFGTLRMYVIFLWVLLLANGIYIYVRWVKSERFPSLTATKSSEGGGRSG